MRKHGIKPEAVEEAVAKSGAKNKAEWDEYAKRGGVSFKDDTAAMRYARVVAEERGLAAVTKTSEAPEPAPTQPLTAIEKRVLDERAIIVRNKSGQEAPKTFAAIARTMGLTRQRVKQIEQEALAKQAEAKSVTARDAEQIALAKLARIEAEGARGATVPGEAHVTGEVTLKVTNKLDVRFASRPPWVGGLDKKGSFVAYYPLQLTNPSSRLSTEAYHGPAFRLSYRSCLGGA